MLSVPHMIVVFIIVLVVFGPQKLPELARSLGKLLAEFRKASADFRGAFEEEMRDLERQAREVERKKAADTAAAAAAAPSATLDQPATQGTPPGAETSPSTDTHTDPIAGLRLTEAPVIEAVAESVPRSDTASGAHLANNPAAVPTETPAPQNAPHDQQPA